MGPNLRQNLRFRTTPMKTWLSAAALFSFTACAALAGSEVTETTAVRTTRDITLDDAVEIGLRQNPEILRALQEIQRTRGLIIEVRAAALPRVAVATTYNQQDPRLLESGGGGTTASSQARTGAALQQAIEQALPQSATGTTAGLDTAAIQQALQSALTTQGQPQGSATGSTGAQDKSWQITIQARQVI